MLAVWQGAAPRSTEDSVDMVAKWGFNSIPVLQYRPSVGRLGGPSWLRYRTGIVAALVMGGLNPPAGLH